LKIDQTSCDPQLQLYLHSFLLYSLQLGYLQGKNYHLDPHHYSNDQSKPLKFSLQILSSHLGAVSSEIQSLLSICLIVWKGYHHLEDRLVQECEVREVCSVLITASSFSEVPNFQQIDESPLLQAQLLLDPLGLQEVIDLH
jgi:hypothetical protein